MLHADDVARMLSRPVIVEEKLDGANVMLWIDDEHRIVSGLRSGSQGLDRGGQLGAVRAWAAQRSDELRHLLAGGAVLYAEWLQIRHSTPYDSLPSFLIGLDVGRPANGFATADARNDLLSAAAVATPPELFRGIVRDLAQLERLIGPSRFGPGPMEGLIVRTRDGGEPRIAKMLRAGFARIDDETWRRARPRNLLADGGQGTWA